ncbi:MAG: hypothetical protein JWM86_2414 [Thermoleophilia bacterium]|nr:hypothetical protein [Thermoleophilia bacterium]
MRVLVSGASGMIGSELGRVLRARGDEVGSLVRGGSSSGLDVAWDPAARTIDREALEAGRFDAVAHLAGETIVGRWTDEKRARIRDSRIDGTRLLAEAISELDVEPSSFIVASATGYYGDRGEEVLTEQSEPGTGFLADVVVEWEAAAEPARAAGIRTAHMRMSAVQARSDGALKELLLPFRLGLGGRMGSGRQFQPWVGLEEAVRMWCFALDTPELEGPVNAIGPTPARNTDHVRALGRAVHRPTFLPTPVFAVKAKFGGDLVDEMLLSSQKVVPARLEALDYDFLDRTIDEAIRRELGR